MGLIELSKARENSVVKIAGFNCGFRLIARLNELGIYKGAKIKILKNDGHGPIVLKIKESRIAIGRGESQKILIEGDA